MSAEEFFHSNVRTRQPYHFTSLLPDSSFKANSSTWTNEYLILHSGDANIQVEQRQSVSEQYGQGKECIMTFKEFIKKQSEYLYMTTQELSYNHEGLPSILSPPLTHLSHDFPMIPAILCNLIPQNINLWMGYSTSITSSGLHHDYHDNLYILLRGKKIFKLYSYKEHENMYTYGELRYMHVNGMYIHS